MTFKLTQYWLLVKYQPLNLAIGLRVIWHWGSSWKRLLKNYTSQNLWKIFEFKSIHQKTN